MSKTLLILRNEIVTTVTSFPTRLMSAWPRGIKCSLSGTLPLVA